MLLSKEGECTDWGIGWHSDLSLHKHSTCNQSMIGLEQLGSSEHSDSQQQGSRNCLGIELYDVVM
jgi:hypothetical protein